MGNTPYGHSIFITEILTWVQGRMGLVALHDRVQTTTTTWDGKTFTANKVQRHGCYQPTQMGKTPYGHSTFITKILTWVQGRMGLVALHDRVQTTTTTLDGKIFTANKVQRHGCYHPTPMGNTPYGHSTFITELLTWVHGRMGLVALHDRVETTTTTSDGKTFTANKVQRHGCYQPTPMENTPYGHSTFITELLTLGTWKDGTSSTTWQGASHHNNLRCIREENLLQMVFWKMVHFALFVVKISINFSPS
jgi:arylamine N-acetyltransferase